MVASSNLPLIVFVGHRQGAWQAAKALGYRVGLISDLRPKKRMMSELAFLELVDFQGDVEALALDLGEKHRGAPVKAVVALTERAVVLAALLREAWQLPGHSPEVARNCHDKWSMKGQALRTGVPVTPYILIEEGIRPQDLMSQLGLPIVLKERGLSGSRSQVICPDGETLHQHLRTGLLAEAFIHGQEMSIESFVQGGEVIFTNFTHYYLQLAINILPAVLEEGMKEKILEFNRQVIKAFGIERGMVHMEVFLTSAGIVLGEVALRPPGGYIMDLLELAYGGNPWMTLLHLELGAKGHFPAVRKLWVASWILHPGAGRVRAIEGLEELGQIPQVVSVSHKLKVGDVVTKRYGSGEDTGRIILASDDYETLVQAIEKGRKVLKVTMEDRPGGE